MGLPAPVAEVLFEENKYKKLAKARVGFIGKQTTYLNDKSLNRLLRKYSLEPPSNFVLEYDQSTLNRTNLGGHFITDKCFISLFGCESYSCIDVSAYEGANVVADLNGEIPAELHQSFDFIFDGSCLDNIFNPARALQNISKMLRPEGRVILINHATWFNGPYSIFSPGWFFDFFASNGYKDCQIYLGLFTNNKTLHLGPMPLYRFDHASDPGGYFPRIPGATNVLVIAIAEKGNNSTDQVLPIQHQYRDQEDHVLFNRKAEVIAKSDRRLFISGHIASPSHDAFVPITTLCPNLSFFRTQSSLVPSRLPPPYGSLVVRLLKRITPVHVWTRMRNYYHGLRVPRP
jgi:SAM-dependent methyltransferase